MKKKSDREEKERKKRNPLEKMEKERKKRNPLENEGLQKLERKRQMMKRRAGDQPKKGNQEKQIDYFLPHLSKEKGWQRVEGKRKGKLPWAEYCFPSTFVAVQT